MNRYFATLLLFSSCFMYCFSWNHWAQLAISTYPLLKQTAEYCSIDERMAAHADASPAITAFIQELLEQHGVKNAQTIAIKLGKEYGSSDISMSIEWLDSKSEFSLLESLIFQYNAATDAQESQMLLMLIYQHIGSIEHEIAHIKNRDCEKRLVSLALVSLTNWSGLKLAECCLTCAIPIEHGNWKRQWAYTIGSGLLLALINKQMLYKICRNQERVADAIISDNASILLAKVNLHTAIYENDKKQVEKQYGRSISWLCQKFPSLYLFFDWEHPTSYERAQTFAARLIKILNQEQSLSASSAI